jgi:hypothetical protein
MDDSMLSIKEAMRIVPATQDILTTIMTVEDKQYSTRTRVNRSPEEIKLIMELVNLVIEKCTKPQNLSDPFHVTFMGVDFAGGKRHE